MKKDTCYMCDKIATSKEHAPPKCFFPEKKDIPGEDFRKNLISVPSCDEHNSRKSKDDVYLLSLITAHFENNYVAKSHYSTKIFRALNKDIGLQKKILQSAHKTSFQGNNTYVFLVDTERYLKELSNIARALYFHEYKEKLINLIQIHSVSLRDSSLNERNDVKQFTNILDHITQEQPLKGNNLKIFSYKCLRIIESSTVIIKMIFYENFSVYAFSSNDTMDGY